MAQFVDPPRALRDLLNISRFGTWPEVEEAVQEFTVRYGPLRLIKSPEGVLWEPLQLVPDLDRYTPPIASVLRQVLDQGQAGQEVLAVLSLSYLFATAHALLKAGQARSNVNGILASIFGPSEMTGKAHGLHIDILAGTVEPVLRDPLDAIAWEFHRSYRKLSHCARCSRFFYRSFIKDKYCSPLCSSQSRSAAQLAYVRKKRAAQNQAKQKTKSRRRT